MKKVTFSRRELYDLVWAESLPKLSIKYDITYTKLRKVCMDMNIPLPNNSYWPNMALGRIVERESLIEQLNGKQEVELILLEDGDTRTAQVKKRVKDEAKGNPIKNDLPVVPKRLLQPDDMVSALKNNLLSKQYDHITYTGLLCSGREYLDVNVTKENISRALRIMDSLIKSLKAKGYTIGIKYGETQVTIGTEDLKISLREMFTKELSGDKHRSSVFKPTGILCFTFDRFSPVQIKDSTEKLEEKLYDIILRMEVRAEKRRVESEYYAQQGRLRDEEQNIKREAAFRREKELADFKSLLSDAKRWKEAETIREYIVSIQTGGIDISEERRMWIDWAKKKADWYDPLVRKEDEFLGVT
jgi:hypothetical protein